MNLNEEKSSLDQNNAQECLPSPSGSTIKSTEALQSTSGNKSGHQPTDSDKGTVRCAQMTTIFVFLSAAPNKIKQVKNSLNNFNSEKGNNAISIILWQTRHKTAVRYPKYYPEWDSSNVREHEQSLIPKNNDYSLFMNIWTQNCHCL